jgi:hypothetical protein
VTTPAGLSNHETSDGGVSFSPDGSTLAICYGHLISLWNHKEAVLVNTIKHSDSTCIENIQFVSTTTKANMVMSTSKSGVLVQSPFGSKGMKGWKCALPEKYLDAVVLNAQFLASHDLVAVSTFFFATQSTKVLLLHASSGAPKKDMIWDVDGKVISIVAIGKPRQSVLWVTVGQVPQEAKEFPIRLYAVTSSGEMLLLKTGGQVEESPLSFTSNNEVEVDVPRIYVPPKQTPRKRRATSIVDEEPSAKRAPPIASLAAFMGDEEAGAMLSSDLPSLGGAFARAFVGGKLATRSSRVVGEQ